MMIGPWRKVFINSRWVKKLESVSQSQNSRWWQQFTSFSITELSLMATVYQFLNHRILVDGNSLPVSQSQNSRWWQQFTSFSITEFSLMATVYQFLNHRTLVDGNMKWIWILIRIKKSYRGKIRRGKVTKFWPGDENFLRRIKFPRRIKLSRNCFQTQRTLK